MDPRSHAGPPAAFAAHRLGARPLPSGHQAGAGGGRRLPGRKVRIGRATGAPPGADPPRAPGTARPAVSRAHRHARGLHGLRDGGRPGVAGAGGPRTAPLPGPHIPGELRRRHRARAHDPHPRAHRGGPRPQDRLPGRRCHRAPPHRVPRPRPACGRERALEFGGWGALPDRHRQRWPDGSPRHLRGRPRRPPHGRLGHPGPLPARPRPPAAGRLRPAAHHRPQSGSDVSGWRRSSPACVVRSA